VVACNKRDCSEHQGKKPKAWQHHYPKLGNRFQKLVMSKTSLEKRERKKRKEN
jgi:hypothetical protein